MHYQKLINKINSGTAIVGAIGLGYAGLPIALRFVDVGYRVIGFDIDPEKVDRLNRGESYITHIEASTIKESVSKGFTATTDFARIAEVDVILICVPTPLNSYRDPDLSYVTNTAETVAKYLHPGQLISLESTTYPGTTDEEVRSRLEAPGLTVGEEIFLVYSPEREDPGNPSFVTKTIPKICGGVTEKCLEVGVALYQKVVDRVVPVISARTAEMTKLLENIHRAVNIGLVNEMKIVADKMGIDIHETIRAAATKPFGFTPYYPGPGWGGHCIPIDPFYLTWKAREYGVNARFIELAGEVNRGMPQWVVGKVSDALNERGKPLKNSRILILGIAYKKNVDDVRESPAIQVMELLAVKQADISYSDPYVPTFPKMREHQFDLSSVELTAEAIRDRDCLILTTHHDAFDYDFIRENATLIVDTRGVYSDRYNNVIKA